MICCMQRKGGRGMLLGGGAGKGYLFHPSEYHSVILIAGEWE